MSTEEQTLAARLDLALTMVLRAFRIQAARSWLALFWPLAVPLFMVGLWMFIGRGVFEVDIPHYETFLLAGLIPWTFVAATLGRAPSALSSEQDLVRRARLPYELLPLSQVAATAAYLALLLIGLCVYIAFRGGLDLSVLPLAVIPVASLVLLAAAAALVISLVDVANRDLRHVLPSLLTLWFFATPIVYRPDMLPGWAAELVDVNPLSSIVGNLRAQLVFETTGDVTQMALVLGACAALFALALVAFRRGTVDLARRL